MAGSFSSVGLAEESAGRASLVTTSSGETICMSGSRLTFFFFFFFCSVGSKISCSPREQILSIGMAYAFAINNQAKWEIVGHITQNNKMKPLIF